MFFLSNRGTKLNKQSGFQRTCQNIYDTTTSPNAIYFSSSLVLDIYAEDDGTWEEMAEMSVLVREKTIVVVYCRLEAPYRLFKGGKKSELLIYSFQVERTKVQHFANRPFSLLYYSLVLICVFFSQNLS